MSRLNKALAILVEHNTSVGADRFRTKFPTKWIHQQALGGSKEVIRVLLIA